MSRKMEGIKAAWNGFPRVSGDEPPAVASGRLQMRFSPRERG